MNEQVLQALKKIKNDFDEDIFNNERRFKAIISDLLPGHDMEGYREWLTIAVKLEAYTKLKQALENSDIKLEAFRLIDILHKNKKVDAVFAKEIINAFTELFLPSHLLFDKEDESIAEQNYIIFYTDEKENLYKISCDGTDRQKLNDDKINTFKIVGNCAYYISCSNYLFSNNNFYKISIDGTDLQKLSDDDINIINFVVVDNWVYYSSSIYNLFRMKIDKKLSNDKSYNLNTGLCKMRIDGTGRQKLSDDKIYNLNIVDDWIYYANGSDNENLYKIRIDGTSRQKLNDDISLYIDIIDDWIYYTNGSDNETFYKIRIDGTNRQKLNDDRIIQFKVIGNFVYYINLSDNYSLCKIRIDGSCKQYLSHEEILRFQVVCDWIYYCNSSDNDNLYKIRIDGTGRQKLNDDKIKAFKVVNNQQAVIEQGE